MENQKLIESIGEIEKILHKNIDSDTLLADVMLLSAKTIDCHFASVSYLRSDHWEIRSVYNLDDSLTGHKTPLEEAPHAMASLNERKLQIVEDPAGDDYICKLVNQGIKSAMVAPLYTRDQNIGVISYYFDQETHFSKEIMIYLYHVSSSLALALENAGLIMDLHTELAVKSANEKKLMQLNRILVILSYCSNIMINAESEEEYLNQICQTIIRESDLALVWVGFIRDKVIRPEFYAGPASGYVMDLSIRIDEGPTSMGPTASSIRIRKSVVCNDIEDSSFKPWTAKARAFNIRSTFSIPLLIRDEPIGIIGLYSYASGFFTSEEMLLFSELGKYVSQGITTIRYEKMKKEVQLSLRESEEQFRMLAHKSNAIIIEVDSSGQILYSNEKFYQTIGIDKTLFKGFTNIINELNNTAHNIEADFMIADMEDKNRWFSFHKSGIVNPKGVMRISYIVFDITSKKETEVMLLRQTEELKNLNATKDKFFGIIAHDMKNPFTSIIGSSELLIDHNASLDLSKVRNLAGIIHDSARRGFALLQNLLDWSRSQTGLISFTPVNLRAGEVIGRCLDDLAVAAEKKNLNILVNNPEDLIITADKNMFCTIIRNLVHNAIKYSWEKSSITISMRRENGAVLVTIKDEGIGITEENIRKLFRIDTGLTTPGTNKEQGTGLGLLLCHEFVKKHQGRIWVESTPGKGCSFFFTLPLAN